MGCGQAGAAAGATTPSGSIPQSAVVIVDASTSIVPAQPYMLQPPPSGVKPALTAEAVRQRLLTIDPGNGLYLRDAAKLTVKMGMYVAPGSPADPTTPYYVFTGGSGDCGAPREAPSFGNPTGASPAATSSAVIVTPSSNTCYSIVIASAKDGTLLLDYSSGQPAP
jgi:hypothetical protein